MYISYKVTTKLVMVLLRESSATMVLMQLQPQVVMSAGPPSSFCSANHVHVLQLKTQKALILKYIDSNMSL